MLGLEHKTLGQLVFDVIDARHALPEWMHQAHAAKWEPPCDWYKEEREQIAKTVRYLIDKHIIDLDGCWKCYRREPNPMQIIAEQSS